MLGREGEIDNSSSTAHEQILNLKLHRYEISALAAASTLGHTSLSPLDQPLGHRPLFDVNAMREWIKTRLTLERDTKGRCSNIETLKKLV